MSVGGLTAANGAASVARRSDQQRQPGPQLTIGERLDLRVLRNLGDRRYLVAYRDVQRIVQSTVSLAEGSKVRAVVSAVGEKLELRYVDTQSDDASASEEAADGGEGLAQLEARYAVTLSEGAREILQVAMGSVADRATMAASGLYLAKLALPVEPDALEALYTAQVGDDAVASALPAEADATLSGIDPRSPAAIGYLATLMGDALDNALVVRADAAVAQQIPLGLQAGNTGAKDRDPPDRRELARRLLNVQDEGSLAYRQGVLPVLISGQLVELDLVYFNERREADRPAGLRRLVMTLKTETLGRIEVQAHAVGDRLSISINAETQASREALSVHADEVRELIARLGWSVETIAYEFDARRDPAARHIVDHVLNGGSLSRLA